MAELSHARDTPNAGRKTESFGSGAKDTGREAGFFGDLGHQE